MKNKKAFVAALILLIVLGGCSGNDNSNRTTAASAPSSNKSIAYESGVAEVAYDMAYAPTGEVYAGGGEEPTQTKKIKTGYMNIETEEVQQAVSRIDSIIAETGGYVENMEMNKYTRIDKEYKSYYYTLRIPAENYEYVTAEIMTLGDVTDFNDSVEDATAVYADISSRLELKTAEEKRLLEFLENAKAIEDIIALEQRLGEVRTDIEIYRDSLINIDRRATYSTLTVNLREIDSPYVIRPVSDKLGDRMKDGFNTSVTGTVNVFQSIIVAIVYISVPLAVAGVCGVVGVVVYRKTRRKSA